METIETMKMIRCADCSRPLMKYIVKVPTTEIKHQLQATCPFCNSQSFIEKVDGDIGIAPITRDEKYTSTTIADVQILENGLSKFIIQKGK